MRVFGTCIAILSFIFGKLLNFVEEVQDFRRTYSIWILDFTILFGFGFDDSSRISGRKALGIQMVETILNAGLN